jgi:hypothetical protein
MGRIRLGFLGSFLGGGRHKVKPGQRRPTAGKMKGVKNIVVKLGG